MADNDPYVRGPARLSAGRAGPVSAAARDREPALARRVCERLRKVEPRASGGEKAGPSGSG